MTGVAIVTTPEEMPVTETLVLLARMEPETGVEAEPAGRQPRAARSASTAEQAAVFAELDRAHDVLTAGRRAGCDRRARRRRASSRPDVRTASATCNASATRPPGLPMVVVPELFTRATGRRVVALVADALAARAAARLEAG